MAVLQENVDQLGTVLANLGLVRKNPRLDVIDGGNKDGDGKGD